MSIYSNVTEQNLDNLRKLAEQQKNQRALKIKNRILKQTHDVKLAESLSPSTDKLDEINKSINESTQELGDVIKKSLPTIENTPQPAIENTPQPAIENNEAVIYDVELENTLNNMKDNTGFFKIEERNNGDVFWKGFLVEKIGGNKIKIINNEYNITKGIQNVLTNKTYDIANSMTDNEEVVFRDILQKTNYINRKRKKRTYVRS